MDERVDNILQLGRPGRETERVRETIQHALQFADELGDHVFDSCHWLMGMHREGNGVAHHVLKHFDVTQSQIEDLITRPARHSETTFRIDDDVHALLDAAFEAANEMSHSFIGTEHLLIGATADSTKSASLLMKLGIDPRDVEHEVLCLLGHRFPG